MKVSKVYTRQRVPRLPSTYQEVEYIQTSWIQRINTWLYAWNNIQTETKVSVETTEQNHPIFWGSNWGGNYYHCTPHNSKWYVGINNSESNGGTYSPVVWTIYTVVFNDSSSYLKVNGSNVVSVSWTQWQSWTTLYIAWRYNWSTWYYWIYKYYYFKMYDKTAWKYVRDMIPCYRKSDGVIGMYDLVSRSFYTNAWTWTFTKWSDVTNTVYKEFQIRPPNRWWTLSWYWDFTTATKANLEAEWWSGAWWGSWSVSSSWLTTSRSNTDRSYMVSLPIQINTNAKSIRIYWVINRTVGSWYGNFSWGIKATNTCGSGRDDYPADDWLIGQSVNCNNNTWYMGYWAWSSGSVLNCGLPWWNANLWYSGSDLAVETIIDIENWEISATWKSWSTTVQSWTATFDIATVKSLLSAVSTNQYLSIFTRNGTGNGKTMKNFGYEIIY